MLLPSNRISEYLGKLTFSPNKKTLNSTKFGCIFYLFVSKTPYETKTGRFPVHILLFIFWEESVVNWAQHNSFFLGLTDIDLIFDQMPTFQTAIHFVLKSSLIVRASCWLKLSLDLLFKEKNSWTTFQILLKLSPCKNSPKTSRHIFCHTVINSTCNTWVGPKTAPCGTPHSLLIFETCSHKLTKKAAQF